MGKRGITKKEVKEAIVKGQQRSWQESSDTVKCIYTAGGEQIVVIYKQYKYNRDCVYKPTKIMRVKYDKEADAIYIELKKSKVHSTVEKGTDFLVDFDKQGKVVGFEVLNYSKAVPHKTERLSISAGQKKILIPA